MPAIHSALNLHSDESRRNAETNRKLAAELRALIARIGEGGTAEARSKHQGRGKLLVRDRVRHLLDRRLTVSGNRPAGGARVV